MISIFNVCTVGWSVIVFIIGLLRIEAYLIFRRREGSQEEETKKKTARGDCGGHDSSKKLYQLILSLFSS